MMKFKLVAESQDRAKKFIPDVLANNKIFYIAHNGGAYVCPSNDFFDEHGQPAAVVPIWSPRYLPYAKKYASGFEVLSANFEEFYEAMLPGMIQGQLFVGLNWDFDGHGVEIPAIEIYDEISALIKMSK